MKKNIRLLLARMIYTVLLFLLTLFIAYRFINRSERGVASAAMAQATFPVIHLVQNGTEMNLLHGYAYEMDVSSMRGPLLILPENRAVTAIVDRYGAKIDDAVFEIRTLDGENLVEQTDITEIQEEQDGRMRLSFTLKDLIEQDEEYMLVLLLNVNEGKQIRYYARIILPSDDSLYAFDDHLAFIRTLHDATFEQDPLLREFLEPDSDHAEDTFEHVNIHSPFAAVTWQGLEIADRTQAQISLYDFHGQTCTLTMRYTMALTEEGRTRRYHVVENYFTRRTENGMYLIDFRRNMNYVFSGAAEDLPGDSVFLSYNGTALQMQESDGGSAIAFVNEERLFVYHLTDNRLTQAFGFFEEEEDFRTGFQGAKINILRMDEGGNVMFRVTGYRNRGAHEGEVGTSVYEFDAQENTINELIWIATTQSEEMLISTADVLGYVNGRGIYYSILGNDVTAIDLYDGTQQGSVENIVDDVYMVSEDGYLMAWQEDVATLPDKITFMEMNEETRADILAEEGEGIRLFGFIGNDIVYGRFREEDVGMDEPGSPVYACYKVVIQHFDGTVFTEYDAGTMRVQDVVIEPDRIVLKRVIRSGQDTEEEEAGQAEEEQTGEEPEEETPDAPSGAVTPVYADVTDDQIMRTERQREAVNRLETVHEGNGTATRITLRDTVSADQCKRYIAQETLSEHHIPDVRATLSGKRYFCVDHNRVAGVYKHPAPAIAQAYELCGQVVDEKNRYIYYRGNLTSRNQILAITEAAEGRDFSTMSSEAACLRMMLDYEGASRNTETLLAQGQTVMRILEDALPTYRILNLEGCPLRAMLYYVDLMCDVPVMARMSDGRYVLLIGFNDREVVLFDPAFGENAVYRIPTAEAAAMFEQSGNHFITYAR
ncbi:MAG: hypothetical protein IJR00_02395 [Lachnospiraceae bacterium]|nr:hypothetical protein [Lachnospiraceae bacterium]